MNRIWNLCRNRNRTETPDSRRDSRKSRRLGWTQPIEALEIRQLLSFTDVSQYAATLPTPTTPTNLYINFDGGTVPDDPVHNPNGSKETIRPFESEPGDTGLDRERDIQDILFEVSEVYAPFNVEVHRIYGAGNYATGKGDTTVFVGGNEANSTTKINPFPFTYSYTKYTYADTPSADSDYPRVGHAINSDAYDVAFVDPVVGSTSVLGQSIQSQKTERGADNSHVNIYDIKRSIVHEAGHTFGLSHVRSDGKADPSPLGTGKVNDVMAYDTGGRNDYFSDQSLNITAANNNGTSVQFNGSIPNYLAYTTVNIPIIGPIQIPYTQNFTTQNSDLTLDYTLGARSTDQYANVADSSAVDPVYSLLGAFGIGPETAKVDLSSKTIQYGTLGRPGDYQVFTITPKTTGFYADQISVHPTVGGLSPELLVYDSMGKNLASYADPYNGTATLTLKNGATYDVVVGSHDGNSTGSYYLGISTVFNLAATQIYAPLLTNTATTFTTASTIKLGSGIGAPVLVPLVPPATQGDIFTPAITRFDRFKASRFA